MLFTEEQISSNFGVSEVDIEQTLSQSFDVFSGIHISESSGTSFNNTELGLNKTNIDGRIPLGLFYFDEDNQYSNNFVNKINDNKFTQLTVENLVINGNGRFAKSFFIRPDGSTSGQGAAFIPEGGWGYCRYDGVGIRYRDDDSASTDYAYEDSLGGSFPEFDNDSGQNDGGGNFIKSFRQDPNFIPDGGIDNQSVNGYAGYLPYHSIGGGGELDADLQTCLEQAESNANADSTKNLCYEFFHLVGKIDGTGTRHSMTPLICNLTGITDTPARFPNIATWVSNTGLPGDGASHGRCLRFLASSYQQGQFDDSNNGIPYDVTDDTFSGWGGTDARLKGSPSNQYRTLNQVIRIYQAFGSDRINPFTTLTVKFRMCTTKGVAASMPEVEVAIIDGDGSVGNPKRVDFIPSDVNNDDVVATDEGYKFPKNFHYWPHGDFNTQRYSDDINDTGTLNKKYSNYGSMGRFKNSQLDKFETFSYKFNLNGKFVYTDGLLRDLHLLVQAGNSYTDGATVYLDDFEVYESEDFVPDVDVRKKIFVGEYGKGDLTKYYDKDLQPEEYKDTTAPLEAQFYFYPSHPSGGVFDIKRTPVYQDFKKGLFYIYDIDWGDNSPNEFKSEPKQIDEETSLYHTYKNYGIFEVTGTMIRMKEDKKNNIIGVICNKKFTLNVNINQGRDEDFQYFGSDGYSFIPYKNTVPMIGGYSEQSIYYKLIFRQVGFLRDSFESFTNYNFYTTNANPSHIGLSNDYPYGQDLFDTDGDGNLDSSFPMRIHSDSVSAQKYFELVNVEQGENFTFTSFTDTGYNLLYTWQWIEEQNSWNIKTRQGYDENIGGGDNMDAFGDGLGDSFNDADTNYGINQINGRSEYTTTEFLKINVQFKNKGDKLKTELALLKMDLNVEENLEIAPYYGIERKDSAGVTVNNGINFFKAELGKSLGDTDITNIKYYDKPKSIWEMLGFEDEDLNQVGKPDEPRYWKNIIPQDYSIYNREGLVEGEYIDTYSQQNWLDDYYYPVLPKYGSDGKFIEGDYPNGKIPLPQEGPITNENENNKNLLINITSETIENNVLNDNSGNQNLGFYFSDYKPNFDDKTLEPKKNKTLLHRLKTSTSNGVF